MRRERRQTKSAVGRLSHELHNSRLFGRSQYLEVDRLRAKVAALETELSELRSTRPHWAWTGTMFIPFAR